MAEKIIDYVSGIEVNATPEEIAERQELVSPKISKASGFNSTINLCTRKIY